jgi:alginate O-acetyltransferase complex protein AlgI
MLFTAPEFATLLLLVLTLYWLTPSRRVQNLLLLVTSYIFYGWVHPWFCILLAISTVVDYFAARIMVARPKYAKLSLVVSLTGNMGMLCVYKYFNFFVESFAAVTSSVGLSVPTIALQIMLPAGISFYTFQTMSYTIDVYRGKLKPADNVVDFALFVSFFPQLVAGPIERATSLLPLVCNPRVWKWSYLEDAIFLMVRGYAYKLIIADNVSPLVDKIFMMQSPSIGFLAMGGFLFSIQIFADFSAYSDIARGVARLFGFSLMVNFDHPYIAISPSDFWRRWHISFSSWIRDYLYIPLGGSRVRTVSAGFFVVMTTMGLSGLWHGAAWNFVCWGLFHGLLLFAYRLLGFGGAWKPKTWPGTFVAWAVMYAATLFGWLLFRAPSMGWLVDALAHSWSATNTNTALVLATFFALAMVYSSVFLVFWLIERFTAKVSIARGVALAVMIHAAALLHADAMQDFIYFQF